MNITYGAYDALQDRLEAILNPDPEWLPTPAALDNHVAAAPEKYLEFLLWLSFTALPAEFADGKARMQAINKILYKEITFEE